MSPRSSRRTVLGRTSSGFRPNFSRSSPCHRSAPGLQSTCEAGGRRQPSRSSVATRRPRWSCRCRRRRRSGAAQRPGAAPSSAAPFDRRGLDGDGGQAAGMALRWSGIRCAARSATAMRSGGRRDRPGAARERRGADALAGEHPAMSSSMPPMGRKTRKSSVLSGSTTHSRPRAVTRFPGANPTAPKPFRRRIRRSAHAPRQPVVAGMSRSTVQPASFRSSSTSSLSGGWRPHEDRQRRTVGVEGEVGDGRHRRQPVARRCSAARTRTGPAGQ